MHISDTSDFHSDLHRLKMGQYAAALEAREGSEHDALSDTHAALRAQMAQRFELCMHMQGGCDPQSSEMAAIVRFLHENAIGDVDHFHCAHADNIRFAQGIGEECRRGDLSNFPKLAGLLTYAVPHAHARITPEEYAAWERQHAEEARVYVQTVITDWRKETAGHAEAILGLLEEHSLLPGLDTDLSREEVDFLRSVRLSGREAKNHPAAA